MSPQKEWRTACRTTVEIPASGDWRKIRIPLSEMNDAEKMVRRQLRGEFFLYNGNNRYIDFPRRPVTLLIADIMLE